MIVIAILSIFAAVLFKRVLAEKGYTESRSWWFPAVAGVIISGISALLNFIAGRMIDDPESPANGIYTLVVSLFAILLHAMIVGKLWRQIKKLPKR